MSTAVIKVINEGGIPLMGTPVAMGKDANGENIGGITNAEGIVVVPNVESGMKFAILRSGFKVHFGTLKAPDANGYIEETVTLQTGASSSDALQRVGSWIGQNIFRRKNTTPPPPPPGVPGTPGMNQSGSGIVLPALLLYALS